MKFKSNPKIKICGIRTLEDVGIVNEFLPEFVGFVLAESKRRVDIETLKTLIEKLDKKIQPVGVFVNETYDGILRAIEAGIKVLQLHGDEKPDYIYNLKMSMEDNNISIWKAIRVDDARISNQIFDFGDIDAVVLDKYSKKQFGGTGEAFNWEIVRKINISYPIILAGGLNSDNVQTAVSIANPWCVDVSSGVEENNKKDKELIKRFIKNIRKDESNAK